MTITLNGDERAVVRGITVADLLEQFGLEGGKIAVERNKDIVARSMFKETTLIEGDVLEIVRFVGG
ncbi:MAG: sulfur carrier protein ThiS, partial [Pseudomonadota bacterium]